MPLNRRSENFCVEAIIVPELELRNVEWQIFSANLVERGDDTADPFCQVQDNRLARTNGRGLFPPHLVRYLYREPQLRPLLLLGEDVALFRRGEAALR